MASRASAVASEIDEPAPERDTRTSSSCAATRRLGIPSTSVRHILHDGLNLDPYKFQSLFQLLLADTAQRETFATWALSKIAQELQWLFNVLWKDEAYFSLHGDVTAHNCHIWATSCSHAYTEQPLHSQRVTIWCGFIASYILGCLFFEVVCQRTDWKTCCECTALFDMLREQVVSSLLE